MRVLQFGDKTSIVQRLLTDDREALHDRIEHMSIEDAQAFTHDWSLWSRPAQRCPDEALAWAIWILMGGRGMGKTRTGGEEVRRRVEAGLAGRIALVGPTAADCRDVMIEGESGLLAISPTWSRPIYEPSKRRLTWPNGARAFTYSAEEPERLRGPQHDFAWGDEPSAWRYGEATWDMLAFGLRLGPNPQAVLTMTPKPLPWIRGLLDDPTAIVCQGALYENQGNLPAAFVERILARYGGTRLGAQEIEGILLGEVEGALWTEHTIQTNRLNNLALMPPTARAVVGVDPPGGLVTECGIVVCAREAKPADKFRVHGYVLDDRSTAGPPEHWAAEVIRAFLDFRCDAIVAEQNFGGEMVRAVIHAENPDVPVHLVHASKGKQPRAEPISHQYAQGRVHHIGFLPSLEAEMTTWVPGEDSPNRMDALVWALTDLLPIDAVASLTVSNPNDSGVMLPAPEYAL